MMDIMAVLALVERGITIISALIAAGKSAAPAIEAVKDLVTGAQKSTITQDDLDKTETLLDSLIADFNLDLPEQTGTN